MLRHTIRLCCVAMYCETAITRVELACFLMTYLVSVCVFCVAVERATTCKIRVKDLFMVEVDECLQFCTRCSVEHLHLVSKLSVRTSCYMYVDIYWQLISTCICRTYTKAYKSCTVLSRIAARAFISFRRFWTRR